MPAIVIGEPISDQLREAALVTDGDEPTRLGALIDGVTLFVFLRYFG